MRTKIIGFKIGYLLIIFLIKIIIFWEGITISFFMFSTSKKVKSKFNFNISSRLNIYLLDIWFIIFEGIISFKRHSILSTGIEAV